MTRIFIQLPCDNEESHVGEAVKALRAAQGEHDVTIVVIDDGSTDRSVAVAREAGADHVLELKRNHGLAMAFKQGVDFCLHQGADILVNFDADGQYRAEDIPRLITPLLKGEADIVIGARNIAASPNYNDMKRRLHRVGTAVLRRLSGNPGLSDPVSGFRALSRRAAQRIHITSGFSYTTEMIIQAEYRKMRLVEIPIETNHTDRPSRLFRSVPDFLFHTGVIIIRTYAMYRPFRFFGSFGVGFCLIGLLPILRFLFFFLFGDGEGKIQSLVIGGTFFLTGMFCLALAILADIVSRNRKLIEEVISRQEEEREYDGPKDH